MNFFILSLFSFYGLAHHTGVVIGTNSGVLLFLDTSTSGYASLLGSAPGGNTEFFETTNWPDTYEPSVE